jgi:hypothetical protein
MGALIEFFGFILEILGFFERGRIRKKRLEKGDEFESEGIDIPVFEYGVMTGFIGSIAASFLLIGVLLLFSVKTYKISRQVCSWQALSLPIGIILGLFGKGLSKRMRDKFDVWYINIYEFTRISVVSFSFLGTFLYTIILYILDIIFSV